MTSRVGSLFATDDAGLFLMVAQYEAGLGYVPWQAPATMRRKEAAYAKCVSSLTNRVNEPQDGFERW